MYDKRIFENSIKWLSLALILTVDDPRRISMLYFFFASLSFSLWGFTSLFRMAHCIAMQFSNFRWTKWLAQNVCIEYLNLICAKQFIYITQRSKKANWPQTIFVHFRFVSSSSKLFIVSEWIKEMNLFWCGVVCCFAAFVVFLFVHKFYFAFSSSSIDVIFDYAILSIIVYDNGGNEKKNGVGSCQKL